MKSEMSAWTLGSAWGAVRKLWWLIVATTILGGLAGYGVAASTTPQFQSTSTLYFAMNQGTSGSDLNQGSTYTQGQMLSFAQLASSSLVLSAVIDDLDLDVSARELSRSIAITIPQDTAILAVEVTSTDPELAAEIANAISVELTEIVQDIVAKGSNGEATITASVIDEAVVPQFQALPNKTRDAGLVAVLGLIVGVLAAFVVTVADNRVRNETVLARVTDAPLLGTISRTKRGADTGLVVARDPRAHVSEDFRRVQSALAFANVDGNARRLLVTSASPGEGKSTFAANLAVTLSELGESTLLVDADLRRPRVGDVFGLDAGVGLTSVVLGVVELDEAIVHWRETGPDVLTSGEVPPNPASILTSKAFSELLSYTSEQHDIVIVDSPPVLTVADTNLLVPLVDGVVIVVDVTRTSRAQLSETIATLEAAGADVLGIVLNKVRLGKDRHTYYTEPAA